MKMNIKCAKCGRTNLKLISNPKDQSIPMYECGQCGNKANIFPQIGNNNKIGEDK